MRSVLATIICTISILCHSSIGMAQRYLDEYRTFYGGVVGGVNFSQIDGDYIKGYNKVGFNVGAIVYTKLDEHLAASIELLYSQKGSRLPSPVQLNQGEYITSYKINLNYAEVPILLNYFDKHKSNFGGGFSYSQLASSTESLTIAPARAIDLNQYPFKKIDLNIVLGGNLHLYHGLFVNIRFQYSLISIRNHIPTDTQDGSQTNNMWVMRLMYLF